MKNQIKGALHPEACMGRWCVCVCDDLRDKQLVSVSCAMWLVSG